MPTLTCASLLATKYSAESLFADSAKKQDYVAEVNAAKAIIENSTARIVLKDENNKVRKATIYWNKLCNVTVGDCTTTPIDLCALTGAEADAACKDYEITGCAHGSFVVNEALYTNSNLNANEVFADNLLKTMKALDEKIAQTAIAKVDSFSSLNAFHGGVGCPGPGLTWAQTYIEPSFWTPQIMPYFLQVSRINKFTNPFLLDGDNLYNQWMLAEANAANADGKAGISLFNKLKYYEDMVNMAIVNPSQKKTFLIDRGSVAFSSYSLWDGKGSMERPLEHGAGKWKFAMPSKNIPGLVYDVYTESICSGPYEKHTVTVVANYDFFNGAEACNGNTGVLEFVCGACPTS